MLTSELLAHWPLAGDTSDVYGKWHGTARHLTFGDGPDGSLHGAAVFNGLDRFAGADRADEWYLSDWAQSPPGRPQLNGAGLISTASDCTALLQCAKVL